MPVRHHLLQIQRKLYERFRSSARQSVGALSPKLRKYYQEYQREFNDYTGISSRSELVHEFLDSDILICGDYHTLPQAQRTALVLLSEALAPLKKRGKQAVLALEMLRSNDLKPVGAYLKGKLSEAALVTAIDFEGSWGFPWESYRPLFEFAREHRVPILGLSPPSHRKATLLQRDEYAAQILVGAVKSNPQYAVLAMMGDMHLGQNHLPAAVRRELSAQNLQKRVLLVHQNIERLYWKLASRGLEHQVSTVRLKRDSFCVMNTPPWVKLQSYLRWVEWTADPSASSVASPLPDMDRAGFVEDFVDLIRTIERFLGVPKPVENAFEVRWVGEGSFSKSKPRPFQRKLRRALLQSIGSLYVPSEKTVWLSSAGVNAASTQAAVYLHAYLSGRRKEYEFPKLDFYSTVWIEALGFLGSKIINPHRRCYGPMDFADAAPVHPLARWVTEHLEAERSPGARRRFRPLALPVRTTHAEKAVFYYRAARSLGQILGAAMILGVSDGKVPTRSLRELFSTPFDDNTKARDLYLRWGRRLDRLGLRDRLYRNS